MPAPYAVLAPDDARRLELAHGDGVRVSFGDEAVTVAVRIDAAMAVGVVGLMAPAGMYLPPGARVSLAHDPDYRPPPASRAASAIIAREGR
jgi:anaerobic selenocysteine-containing dehydrogenase